RRGVRGERLLRRAAGGVRIRPRPRARDAGPGCGAGSRRSARAAAAGEDHARAGDEVRHIARAWRAQPGEDRAHRARRPRARARVMKSKLLDSTGQKTFALVFDKEDEVVAGLTAFAKAERLGAAHFTAIGAFSEVTLGYFERARKDYKRMTVAEQVEVL